MSLAPVVVLISGNGSNLQSLIDNAQDIGIDIAAVISNQPDAYGLERARNADIATHVVQHKGMEREQFDAELLAQVEQYQPQLVVLSGFMRILTSVFVEPLLGRLMNIHPSLLPKYPGLDTHSRALEAGDRWHGASVHFVTNELDGGPVIAHSRVCIKPDDTADSLKQRVLKAEHKLYPRTIALYTAGRLRYGDGKAWLNDKALPPGGLDTAINPQK